MLDWRERDAHYTSADERCFFGWDDVAHFTPSQLADAFVERLPDLAKEGRGSDWLYAGWYVEMLHLTYPDVLPVAYHADRDTIRDSEGAFTAIECIGERQGIIIPPPPPGYGLFPEVHLS